ncbi:MAG: aminopeptidase P family protein [Rhodospirillaceae bacterium]|jgi:Xaa-Pro dipeptidase|nr:aminopeptidase P family protein [Rhodospirillaceae bacterium]
MPEHRIAEYRIAELRRRMADENIDLFIINDPDSIYYFANFWNYLGMEFGRATLATIPLDGDPVLIAPAMETEMASTLTSVARVEPWSDGDGREWLDPLVAEIEAACAKTVALEWDKTHPLVLRALSDALPTLKLIDASRLTSAMRMVKTADEISIMRQAGQVATAMGDAGRNAIGAGVPEYEVALAVNAAGTRKAAELLGSSPETHMMSPNIFNLQILQSGHHTCMVHGRPTTREIQHGDPVYLCFCGIANFRQFKLGFDRQYFVGSVSDEMARTYETTIAAQAAALAEIRPGAIAEDINAAAEEVYLSAGFGPSYRTGRGIGYSYLEEPQLKRGDRTPLQAGMTFAVDGGITVPGAYGSRVGDSIVVTETGYEQLTVSPSGLTLL